MTRCKFRLPTGEPCHETGIGDDGFCKWHAQSPPESNRLKEALEQRVKNGQTLAGFNLSRANLSDIYLVQADLRYTDLRYANLSDAHLYGANLEGADLFKANLESANLKNAALKNTNLLAAALEGTKLENARWDTDYIILNEREARDARLAGNKNKAREKYREAEEIYRNIKFAYRMLGHSKDQSPFFYREMVAHRKQMPLFSARRFALKVMDITTGYGEKPLNVFGASVFTVLLSALLYGIFGVLYHGQVLSFRNHEIPLADTIGNMIYFSSVVFTTIGFGDIIPFGVSKWIMTVEGFLGQILIAFLVVCIYKKLMER